MMKTELVTNDLCYQRGPSFWFQRLPVLLLVSTLFHVRSTTCVSYVLSSQYISSSPQLSTDTRMDKTGQTLNKCPLCVVKGRNGSFYN